MTVEVRKFEPGASSLYFYDFLEACGYQVRLMNGDKYRLRKGTRGRWKEIRKKELFKLIDELRIERGLEPFQKQ